MAIKKIYHRTRTGLSIAKNQGFTELGIRTLMHVQKKRRKSPPQSDAKIPVIKIVRYEDVIDVDFTSNKIPSWKGTSKKTLTINWLMPPPGKGSGGHMTLFRFLGGLERRGHKNRIYYYSEHHGGSVSAAKAIMAESFPKLNAEVYWLNELDEIEEADAQFATSWETAYASYKSDVKAKRFYFVQDFEPYFYPVGGMYILAENTYRFGFHGITAGGWLAKKLSEDYGMKTNAFAFGSDSSVYRYENSSTRKEVACYVRPYTDRRGFEIAMLTLDLFHRKHPEYTINLFGYDVSSYDIPFPYNNLGILDTAQLNKLYNRCAVALVMSCTNMSLLPLELLSAGSIPVVNDGPNNRLVSSNEHIIYAANNPISLSDALSSVVKKKSLTQYAKKASESVSHESWSESTGKMAETIEKEIKKPTKK